ncbi:MAG: DUF58 domain-containing protein [Lachnospiraceae bacterium]|nr:DUF58 domain-containing protein [Lachnospiraceae bacterium]
MISLFLLAFLSLIILWNLYYATHWNKNLTISLAFCQDFVYAGEQAELTEQIENRKSMMLPVLEVAFHMDKKLSFHDCENTSVSDYTYKRDIFALLGNQRITRKLTLDCKQRGYYQIDKSHLTAFSMLYRKRFSIECPADTALYVYAARTNVADILIACERLMGNIQCAKRLYEDPFAFSSIREYTVTDPMNTINWKASARTGELMVNTFESTLTQKVVLYLDIEDRGILKYEHLIEESISVAATLTRKFIARGMEVGICVNTDINVVEPAGGKKQLANIEQMLAKCKSDDSVIPFTSFLKMLFCPQTDLSPTSRKTLSAERWKDAFSIFISKNAIQNQTAIEQFIGKEQPAIWVVPYSRSELCDIITSDNIRLIKREGAQA